MSVQKRALLDRPAPAASNELPATHELREATEHAARLVPALGPITAFVHHNALHAFEDLNIDDDVQKRAATFGCQPHLPQVPGDYADGWVGRLGRRHHLRLATMQRGLQSALSRGRGCRPLRRRQSARCLDST
jgi:hypothetical protein